MQKAKWVLANFAFIIFRLRPDWEGVRMIRISETVIPNKYLQFRNFRKKLKYYLRLVLLLLEIIRRIVDLLP